MTQPVDPTSQAAGEGDLWAAWERPAGAGPAGKDGGPSGPRRALMILLPLAVLALLSAGVVLFLLSGDPASAAGSCGGG